MASLRPANEKVGGHIVMMAATGGDFSFLR
jgi:hypothetical protein